MTPAEKIHDFFYKIHELFWGFCFTTSTIREMFLIKNEDWRESPLKPKLNVILMFLFRYCYENLEEYSLVFLSCLHCINIGRNISRIKIHKTWFLYLCNIQIQIRMSWFSIFTICNGICSNFCRSCEKLHKVIQTNQFENISLSYNYISLIQLHLLFFLY